MSLEHLAVELDDVDLDTLLNAWLPLIGPGQLPMLVTALGDVFVQHEASGRVSFLYTSYNQLEAVCGSADELTELLEDPEFVDHYFDPGVVATLAASGMSREPNEVFALLKPRSAGGDWDADNIVVLEVAEHLARGP